MLEISICINKIVAKDSYDVICEAFFIDYYGEKHTFRDKLPIFYSNYSQNGTPKVPIAGIIRGELIEKRVESVVVNCEFPDDVADMDGNYIFEVNNSIVNWWAE